MKKKGFLVNPLLDVFSIIIFILASIIFYFVFKVSAQQSNIIIGTDMATHSFLPDAAFFRIPVRGMTMTEALANGERGDFQRIYDAYYWNYRECPTAELALSHDLCTYLSGDFEKSKTIDKFATLAYNKELPKSLPVSIPGYTFVQFYADIIPEAVHES